MLVFDVVSNFLPGALCHIFKLSDLKGHETATIKRDKENRLRIALHQKVGFSLQYVGEEISGYYNIQTKMLMKLSCDSEAA